MKIKKMILTNFRAYKHVEIDFDDFNCIVGKNDVGKSTIFVALEWFFGQREFDGYDFNYDTIRKNQSDSIFGDDGEFSVEIIFTGEMDEMIQCVNVNSFGSLKTHYFVKDFIEDDCICIKKQLVNPLSWNNYRSGTKPNVYEIKAYYFDEIGNIFSKIDINTLREKHLSFNLNNTSKRKVLNEYHEESEKICDDLFKYCRNNTSKRKEKYIGFDYDKLMCSKFSELFRLQRTTDTIDGYIKLLLRQDYFELQRRVISSRNKIAAQLSNEFLKSNESFRFVENSDVDILANDILMTNGGIPLQHRGEGFQTNVKNAIFRLLSDPKFNSNQTVIMGFEEPETHLHPNEQRKMYETLKNLSKIHQVIITTHSPFIVKELAKEKEGVKCIVLKQTNGSTERIDVAERVLKYNNNYVSMNEINYIAFAEGSIEFHIELFGYMHRLINERNSATYSLEQIDDYLKTNYKANLRIEKFYRIGKKEEPIIRNDKETLPEKRFVIQERSLPYCVRNQIDHPHPLNSKFDNIELIKQSIDYMIGVINDLKSKSKRDFV